MAEAMQLVLPDASPARRLAQSRRALASQSPLEFEQQRTQWIARLARSKPIPTVQRESCSIRPPA